MKNKICVYTCITGNYDNLKEIEHKEIGIDYYCFTNNKDIKSKTWKVVYIEDSELSNVQLARKIKILGHPSINNRYDILLWMDGAIVFRKNIADFIEKYLTKDDVFVAFKHEERNSIKEECNACLRLKKETKENINKVLKFYKKEKYPDNNGLIESTVYIKRTGDKLVEKTLELWFDMIINFTKRDQLSFNYCIYKTGLVVKWINEKVFNNEWFDWENHNYETKIELYRLYFGDENDYDIKNDIQGFYKINNQKYVINTKVPNTADSLILDFSKVPCTILKNIRINKEEYQNIEYYNCVDYKGKKVFYNQDAIMKINNRFNKNEKLEIELELEIMTKSQLLSFINEVCIKLINQSGEIICLKQNNHKLQEEKEIIINSKGWKFLEALRRIKNK